MARSRDPGAFAALAVMWQTDPSAATPRIGAAPDRGHPGRQGRHGRRHHLGDCLELLAVPPRPTAARTPARTSTSSCTAGTFPATAPPRADVQVAGQLTAGQLIDRYAIACRPVRDLLVDYLRERQPAIDYATLQRLARALAGSSGATWKSTIPGSTSLLLAPHVAAAWKQRITVKTTKAEGRDGEVIESQVPRQTA